MMRLRNERLSASVVSMILIFAAQNGAAQETPTLGTDFSVAEEDVADKERPYSPYVHSAFPQQVFWGESHLHTSYSWDAGLVGNTLGPDEAYRFAKGEQVITSTGQPAKLVRPLDWLMIADHAESLGVAALIERSDPAILATEVGHKTHELYHAGDIYGAFEHWGLNVIVGGIDPLDDPKLSRTVWHEIVEAAEDHNMPGLFTSFIGFEWSSSPEGSNLHRVVMMRDDADKAKQVLPFGADDSSDPEDLWAWMALYEEETGGEILAIAHNGNLSNGAMFALETLSGQLIDKDFAEQRIRWEPLYEVTQMKGDGEAHPFLSPDDEFADYGTWDRGNWNGDPKLPEMLEHEYARGALKLGLRAERDLGVNPFKFGLVGATDAHTSLATTREENNFGKVSVMEPGPDRFDAQIVPDPQGAGTGTYEFETLAAGLQGVWASANTREALFDAMQRKETYATTGTRITVRVFGGWEFDEEDVLRPGFAKTGYLGGVPMGGDLRSAPDGAAPTFMIRALRDPDGANLDRVQIIKGWLDGEDELHERVYDVAVSDGRAIGPDGRCTEAVGDTVDVAKATFTNSVGDALLMGFWKDPDFDPDERAFYYVRVLEIPTPRWTTYDAAFFGLELPAGVPPSQQERAYTSPIWYTP